MSVFVGNLVLFALIYGFTVAIWAKSMYGVGIAPDILPVGLMLLVAIIATSLLFSIVTVKIMKKYGL